MATARARRGFTLPLTMALAFSLMAMATAIVGMVLVSDKQSKATASEMVTRASLESAIHSVVNGISDTENRCAKFDQIRRGVASSA